MTDQSPLMLDAARAHPGVYKKPATDKKVGTAPAPAAAKGPRLTMVSFSLGGQTIAIPASFLREVLEPLPVTRVPGAGAFAPGVVNVRGSVVPLADLGIALNMPRTAEGDRQRIMVVEVELEGDLATIAVLADEVHEVTSIVASELMPVPASMTKWPQELVQGLYKSEAGFVVVPDLVRIFSIHAQKSNSYRNEER